ncbi:type IV secretion system protein [Campylobacter sp. CNRCH_2007_0968H]|uniref:type IV secretion system protein n=1 Tax=Campylobacter sp. CNRCH_2007_0968H TaxID=2911598 RepID=UPI0021E69A18|nr:type IV secretion system protein [Campylobacter sp. CNRCH_2007_0968H]MCV3531276.1 type IV secretion system protein [Campylobacter sp. CNRCH_2007_0968H]
MKLKKRIALSLLIFSNSLYCAGIPVIDAAAIAQAVTNYQQMVTQYQQMLKDTMNFEKQMKELGVDMTSINEILGSANTLIRETENLYNGVKAVPKDFYGEVEDITKACSFLERESSFFGMKIQSAGNKYTDKINNCLSAISDVNEINKTIKELTDKSLKITDTKLFNENRIQIQNLINAKEYLKSKANQDKINKMIAFYDTYQKNESTNPYTKAKMDKDLQNLAKQLTNSNNHKQAQALTNAILIKILEMSQRQYELSIYYSQVLTAVATNGEKNFNQPQTFNLTYKEPEDPKEYNPFLKDVKEQRKDENGFPIFDF